VGLLTQGLRDAIESREACEARKERQAAAEQKFAQCKPKFLNREACELPDVVMRIIRVAIAPPVIASFSATPDAINPEGTVQLKGAVQNATEIEISSRPPANGPGSGPNSNGLELPAAMRSWSRAPIPPAAPRARSLSAGYGP
jgi:hypothetical protein